MWQCCIISELRTVWQISNPISKELEARHFSGVSVHNTLLCLKMYDNDGKRIVGFKEYDDWLEYNINTNAYINCQAPKGMKNLITHLKDNGVKIYGLTECSNSFEYNSKYNRLREVYDGLFTQHGDLISIDTRKNKVKIMKMIAKKEKIPLDEIMFVDDSYCEIMEAFDAGIFAMHTTEAMERFLFLKKII